MMIGLLQQQQWLQQCLLCGLLV